MKHPQFSSEEIIKETEMNKMKPAPSTIVIFNALARDVYGMDMPMAKRQIQVEKRKVRLAETKSKDLETKSKELTVALVLNLRFNRTAEQLAIIAKISVQEIQAILDAHPLEK
jgi:hypothetical protein